MLSVEPRFLPTRFFLLFDLSYCFSQVLDGAFWNVIVIGASAMVRVIESMVGCEGSRAFISLIASLARVSHKSRVSLLDVMK